MRGDGIPKGVGGHDAAPSPLPSSPKKGFMGLIMRARIASEASHNPRPFPPPTREYSRNLDDEDSFKGENLDE